MKRKLTFTLVLLCLFAFGYSQNGIQGGGFESWKKVDKLPNSHYYEPDNSWFSTLNILDTIPTPPGITAYPCDTVHGGLHSARVITRKIDVLSIVIPGVIGTIKIKWSNSSAILGMPYPYGDSIPKIFSGFYKFYPLANDSAAAVILLSKWNNATHRRDTIAYDRLVFRGTVSDFTEFSTPVTYLKTATTPDSLTILLLSCAGFNARNMFGSVGTVGTQAIFDDVSLTGVNGIPLLLMPSVSLKLFPNPASSIMRVEMNSEVNNGSFEVYDASGKFLRSVPVNGKSCTVNVKDLTSGVYFYKLTRNSKNLNSGTFIVSQ